MLKPHDVLCVLKILCLSKTGQQWTFRELGGLIGLSSGETFNSLGRLKAGGLVVEKSKEVKLVPHRLLDFLVHGVPTVFYSVRGQVTRGMLTGHHAAPLLARCPPAVDDIPLVWPKADGKARGETLMPIYESAPAAAAADVKLYELLVLVDGIRAGRTKEKKIAAELLAERLLPADGGQRPATD
jgi:hypothetical protein